jgi:hypothetical protein
MAAIKYVFFILFLLFLIYFNFIYLLITFVSPRYTSFHNPLKLHAKQPWSADKTPACRDESLAAMRRSGQTRRDVLCERRKTSA